MTVRTAPEEYEAADSDERDLGTAQFRVRYGRSNRLYLHHSVPCKQRLNLSWSISYPSKMYVSHSDVQFSRTTHLCRSIKWFIHAFNTMSKCARSKIREISSRALNYLKFCIHGYTPSSIQSCLADNNKDFKMCTVVTLWSVHSKIEYLRMRLRL